MDERLRGLTFLRQSPPFAPMREALSQCFLHGFTLLATLVVYYYAHCFNPSARKV